MPFNHFGSICIWKYIKEHMDCHWFLWSKVVDKWFHKRFCCIRHQYWNLRKSCQNVFPSGTFKLAWCQWHFSRDFIFNSIIFHLEQRFKSHETIVRIIYPCPNLTWTMVMCIHEWAITGSEDVFGRWFGTGEIQTPVSLDWQRQSGYCTRALSQYKDRLSLVWTFLC